MPSSSKVQKRWLIKKPKSTAYLLYSEADDRGMEIYLVKGLNLGDFLDKFLDNKFLDNREDPQEFKNNIPQQTAPPDKVYFIVAISNLSRGVTYSVGIGEFNELSLDERNGCALLTDPNQELLSDIRVTWAGSSINKDKTLRLKPECLPDLILPPRPPQWKMPTGLLLIGGAGSLGVAASKHGFDGPNFIMENAGFFLVLSGFLAGIALALIISPLFSSSPTEQVAPTEPQEEPVGAPTPM